jgi:hypothetical protein
MVIVGIIGFAVLLGLLFLFRGAGRWGQTASPKERSQARADTHQGPRTPGLN